MKMIKIQLLSFLVALHSLASLALVAKSPNKGTQSLLEQRQDLEGGKSRWPNKKQRRFSGHAYIDHITCWAAFAEKHKLPWVVIYGSLLHWTNTEFKEHTAWDPDIDILTTPAAQELIRKEFRGHKSAVLSSGQTYGLHSTGSSAGSAVLGPNVGNCRAMKKQHGVDEINNGPTFGRVQSAEGWTEFWSEYGLPAEVRTFYSDFETDVFANRRLVDYNFRQHDGTLESVPIYIPAKDFSDFLIGYQYKSAERPTFNQWTGQRWVSNESVWQRWQTGNGPLIDYGPDVPAHVLAQFEPTSLKSFSTTARSNRKPRGFLALMQQSNQQHDVSFAASTAGDRAHSVEFFGMLAVAFLLVPAVLWCIGAPFVMQVFAVYVSLYMTWSMLTYAARDASYNSAILVLNALLLKLALSLGLWRAFDGSSFTELAAAVWKERDTMCRYAFPSGLYALGDVLRVVALRLTSPGTFAVIFNSRVLFLVFAWQYWMGRRLKAVHWLSLVLILVGTYAKEAHNLDFGHHQIDSKRYYGYEAVLVLGVCTATAAVLNEGLLQQRSGVSVNLQNLAMYGWGLVWTTLISVIWMLSEPDSTTSSLFHSDAWLAVWAHPLVLGQAVVLALYGVTTAYFLRYLNNIAREVAVGVFAVLSVAMDYFVFGATLQLLEFVGAFLLVFGVGLFAWRPVTAPEQAAGLGNADQVVEKECGSVDSLAAITTCWIQTFCHAFKHSLQSERSTSEGSASGLEDLESHSSK